MNPYDQDPEQQANGYNSYGQPQQPYTTTTSPPPPIGFQPRRTFSPPIQQQVNYPSLSQQPTTQQQQQQHVGFSLQDNGVPGNGYNSASQFTESYDQPNYYQSQAQAPIPTSQHPNFPAPLMSQYDSQYSLSTSTAQQFPGGYQQHQLQDPFRENEFDSGGNEFSGGGEVDGGIDLPLLTPGGGYRRRMPSGLSNNGDMGGGTQQDFSQFGESVVGGYPGGNGHDNSDDNEHQEPTVRYGKIPQRQMRRYKTVKSEPLFLFLSKMYFALFAITDYLLFVVY